MWAGWLLADALLRPRKIDKLTPALLAAFAERAPTLEPAALLAADRRAELESWLWGRPVVDALAELPVRLEPQALVDLLKPLQPDASASCCGLACVSTPVVVSLSRTHGSSFFPAWRRLPRTSPRGAGSVKKK